MISLPCFLNRRSSPSLGLESPAYEKKKQAEQGKGLAGAIVEILLAWGFYIN